MNAHGCICMYVYMQCQVTAQDSKSQQKTAVAPNEPYTLVPMYVRVRVYVHVCMCICSGRAQEKTVVLRKAASTPGPTKSSRPLRLKPQNGYT